MCGRYTLDKESKELADRFEAVAGSVAVHPNYNVAPSQSMPVVTEDVAGKRHLELMKWGIPRMLGKDLVKELINTRADKAFGGFWKKTVLNQRCLIPADGFYEWHRTKESKIPFYIHPKKIELYAFAGIWDMWKGPEGQQIKTYSIMTTEPNKEMSAVHNRMPVILHPEDEAAWLAPSSDKPELIGDLLAPFEDNGLELYRVGTEVNNPRNNSPHLLEPAA